MDRALALERLLDLIQRLKPLDRQVILSYLEGMDAAAIGEITGISASNAATKIHRIKQMLARQFHARSTSWGMSLPGRCDRDLAKPARGAGHYVD